MNIQAARTTSAERRAAARERRPGRGAHAQPPGGAQQPVGGAARRARRRAHRHRQGRQRARRRAGGQWPRVLRRPRPQGADRPPQRRRRRPRLFPADHDTCSTDDAADRRPAPAGDRGGARRGVGGRLPARRQLRSRRRLGKAGFATPGVDIGLFCSTPMVALSRNVARKHAMEMLLTGDIISAEKAAAIGLVNEVVAAGQERARAIELASNSHRSRRTSSASARRRSTARSNCRSPRPTPTPRR